MRFEIIQLPGNKRNLKAKGCQSPNIERMETSQIEPQMVQSISSSSITQQQLQKVIEEFTPKYQKLHKYNRNTSLVLGVSGIVLSLGAAISGILIPDNAKAAAVFAACALAVQAALLGYPVDRWAAFYRAIAAKNMNLLDDLKLNYSEQELRDTLEKFKAIRLEAAVDEPQSSNLSESLNLKNVDQYMVQLKELLNKYEQMKP